MSTEDFDVCGSELHVGSSMCGACGTHSRPNQAEPGYLDYDTENAKLAFPGLLM